MSWFSSAAVVPIGENLHTPQTRNKPELLFGKLEKEDTEWLCAGGFVTETQTFYATTVTGGIIMCQVIHSSLGVWYPSIHITFRYVEPSKKIHIFKSTPVTNFITSPSSTHSSTPLDKRSCKSDQFSITLDPNSPNKYVIEGKYDDQVQINLTYETLVPGWKLGAGPQGGMTYFGALASGSSTASTGGVDYKSGGDGYAIHRFWPRCKVGGIMVVNKEVIDLSGARGTFIHAIQGMRPNVLAAQWNFANFQSTGPLDEEGGDAGVALTMMEFLTTPAYGSAKINVGSVVVGDKLIAITVGGEGITSGGSKSDHLNPTLDLETGYLAPGTLTYDWEGATFFSPDPTLIPSLGNSSHLTKASLSIDLGVTSQDGETYASKSLVEKVDVLGQLPALAKKIISYAAGTKPYIYTFLNDTTATITLPSDLSDSSSEAKTIQVKGTVFNEATFVSS